MSTSADFIHYALDQLQGLPYALTARRMFGEFMIFADGKPLFLVCDETVYAKILPPLLPLLHAAEQGAPYPGAKMHYIVDVDDREQMQRVARTLYPLLTPARKKTKPK